MAGLDDFALTGQVALVTGGNRGLGQALALGLAEAGADVAVLARADAADTVAAVAALGRRAQVFQADLATAGPEALAGLVDEAAAAFGRLDILVNNAGVIRRRPAVETPAADWSEVLRVNLDAAFYLAQAAGRQMLAQGRGKIVNIASLLSFQGGVTVPAYTASKHALAGLTKALANEWAALGVNVNAIAPGYMATDNTAALRADAARRESISARIPAGRWGVPADLMGTVVYLCSRASDYVHGAVIPVDGGWLAR
ncbi:MAG: 2-dehydro-3-deoxy-D-gluconate 5-dehydrogenase KduD [Propionibacteriaceae bacterium]|jgi:2-deoxy-D-gluconate 3-dehydrogenase|nr:2-dehydro-3-deoxy-D-gluconate 5-dehydrogenase KduD [Propionibacteriaceae bacterium]